MGDINITCAISRKNLNTNEKVKLFFLTNGNNQKFDPNMTHLGFKSPFLYIDAIYTGNGDYEVDSSKKNEEVLEHIKLILLERGFFKNNDEPFYEAIPFNLEFNKEKDISISNILDIMHRKTISILLDYNSLNPKGGRTNSTILKTKLALNLQEFSEISLMVVKESVFNVISFMGEPVNSSNEYTEMIENYKNSTTFCECINSLILDNCHRYYQPLTNVSEKVREILSEVFVQEKFKEKYKKEQHIQSENFEERFFVEHKIDLFLDDPERYLLHNKFLHNLEKLDIVLMPSIYSYSPDDKYEKDKIKITKELIKSIV